MHEYRLSLECDREAVYGWNDKWSRKEKGMKKTQIIIRWKNTVFTILLIGGMLTFMRSDILFQRTSEDFTASSDTFDDENSSMFATSTDSVLGKTYDQLISSLNHKIFTQYLDSLCPEESCPIPGLSSTQVGETENCDAMVPQGMCLTEKYMLISAYDSTHKIKKNSKFQGTDFCHDRHQSVIYVLDRDSKEYLTTLILHNSTCHVGSIAYNEDDEVVYIADSDNNYIWKVGIREIKKAVRAKDVEDYPYEIELKDYFAVENRPSAICYYRKHLYVGEYANVTAAAKSRMLAYDSDGRRTSDDAISLPCYTQGIAFAEMDGETYLFVSTSKGRYVVSNLYIYNVERLRNKVFCVNYKVKEVRYPNMSEDIVINGDCLYSCYESAANFYHKPLDGGGRSRNTVDRIMANSVESLLNDALEDEYDMAMYSLED